MGRAALLALAFVLAPAARAEPGRWVASFDFLPHTGLSDALASDVNAAAAYAVAAGSPTASGSFSIAPAYGGRLAYLLPIGERFEAGPSLGFLYGPTFNETLSATGPGGTVYENNEGTIWWWRALLQAGTSWHLGAGWRAEAGAGAGAAFGRQSETQTCGGACPGETTTAVTSGVGFAWEAGAGLAYKQVGLWLTGSGLPQLPRNPGNIPFPAWTTLGLSLRWNFR